MSIHVVYKKNNAVTATFPYNESLPSLGPSSVRVKTDLLAITSNNLSYARNGTLLHWWELYPVPADAPSPYNDNSEWGIVPAWGYGIVTKSNISEIKPGAMLHGFWPTSSYPVDLELEPWKVKGQWNEVSQHRSQNMTVYNRYTETFDPPSDDERGIAAGVQAVWQCAYLLNLVTFPTDKNIKPIHPLGMGHEWAAKDADLSDAVVISLSAASKTARSFAWNFSKSRPLGINGPLGLLQATSNTKNLVSFPDSGLPTHNTNYGELSSKKTLQWLSILHSSRFVIFDFGAATSVLLDLVATLSSKFKNATVTTFSIGSESKVYTAEETTKVAASREQLKKIQVNTSTLRDRAIETFDDPTKYFESVDDAWRRCVNEGGMGDVEILWRKGVIGANGIEGMWQDVCCGKARGDQCLVVKVQE